MVDDFKDEIGYLHLKKRMVHLYFLRLRNLQLIRAYRSALPLTFALPHSASYHCNY